VPPDAPGTSAPPDTLNGVTDNSPTVFISYSHQDKPLALAFARGLQAEGLQVWVDENELLPGDSIIEQVSTAVQDVDFFCPLVSEASRDSRWCQKELSLAMTRGLGREGATILPVRVGDVEMPDSIKDLLYVDLDPTNPGPAITRISRGVRRHRQRRGTAGDRDATQQSELAIGTTTETKRPPTSAPGEFEPISIVGVVKEGIGQPRNDNTRGRALYRVPLRLSRRPSLLWAQLLKQVWDRPPSFTTMHRPGIASVQGDTIVLNGTTMEELERYHAETLRGVLDEVNRQAAQAAQRARAQREIERQRGEAHSQTVDAIADRLKF
jgi:hypothetical protein